MAGGARKFVVGCLVVAGALVLGLVLLFVGYGLWGMHANERAERAAKALCSSIHPGDPIEAVVAKAQAGDPPDRTMSNDEGEYRFTYNGMIFNARECLVSTTKGRVTATHFVVYDD